VSIQSDIVAALNGSPITSAGSRVYPQAAPQDASLPFVVYRRLSQEPIGTIHNAAPIATKSVFVFECYATSYQGALTLADEVRASIQASSVEAYPSPSSGEEYAPAVDEFMEPVQYEIWH
jgi:hypothetical protein